MQGWVPKHHSVCIIGVPNGNSRECLTFELLYLASPLIRWSVVVTDCSKWQENAEVRLDAVKQLVRGGQDCDGRTVSSDFGGGSFDRDQVHTLHPFVNRPVPNYFGDLRFSEQGPGNNTGHFPMAFDQAVLGLTVGRGCSETNSVRVEEIADFVPLTFKIEVALDATRETPGIDKEAPECI